MTVQELLTRVSAQELAEWLAYYELEPWGEWRADTRAGIVACTVANAHRNPKKQRKAYTPEDFMPDFTGERRKQAPGQMQELARMMAAAGYGTLREGAE